MHIKIFADANVLFSKTLMDWLFLFRLHLPSRLRLLSSEDVMAEVLANMRKKHPFAAGHVTARRLELIRQNLDEAVRDFPGSLVFTGADPEDYHIHAASTHADVDFLLTSNRAEDFTASPANEVYQIISPDDFFTLLANEHPDHLREIVKEQEAFWSARPKPAPLDLALERAGCTTFAGEVRRTLGETGQ